MNRDDDSKEPVTDLSLSLDFTNQGTPHLIKNSGAGANAASRVDMAFVASDHLAELVWSPRKGLSVKCTNCSTAAEESKHMLAMGKKVTSANQDEEVKRVRATTSATSPGRYVTVEIACQSAHTPVNEGSRCNSSPCLKDVSELHISPVNPMFNFPIRKRHVHTFNKYKNLQLHDKAERPQLCSESNIDDVNQHSIPTLEENQKGIAFKMRELYADADLSVFKGKSCPGENSRSESKINEYRLKGKAKVISDAKVQHGEEESHGSIESSSSVGSFCSRQRKRSLEQKLTSECKRFKKTIQPGPRPAPLVNGSSSFISWISNMTKGINKANKDGSGTPCLALTVTPSCPQTENPKWELIPNRSDDKYPHQRMGFQNIFQSMYCTSSKVHNRHATTDGHQKSGEPIDSCIGNTMVDVSPLSMYEMTSSSCKGDQSSGNGEKQLQLQKMLSRIGDNTERNSSENGASCNLLSKVQSIKVSRSRSSPHLCGTQNNDSIPPPKINAGLTDVSDPLQSFWITRFCSTSIVPKSVTDNHGHLLLIDNQAKNSKSNIFRSSEVTKVAQARGEWNEDLNQLAGGQGDIAASDSDASVGLKEDAKFIAAASDCNVDQILISERLKNSEAMASMFVRRLDAIKNMSPADITCNASVDDTTCFYCGKKGHNLRNCSEFAENNLEGLLDKFGFPDSFEKTPSLCSRCFQLGHWAKDCQNTHITICEPLATANDELPKGPGDRGVRNKEVVFKSKDAPKADIPCTPCNRNNLEPNPELYKLCDKSGPIELELEASALAHLPNSIDGQSSDILKLYFEAVRLLRLSRREILKLMDSKMDMSNLEGCFLRLRVGNMEKGHSGTGYHVAYIDGIQSEELCRGSKFILPMNMGGIKILVGSQSISNQDFLENELLAWWSAIVKNGNKLPTLAELNDKLQQRNKLQL